MQAGGSANSANSPAVSKRVLGKMGIMRATVHQLASKHLLRALASDFLQGNRGRWAGQCPTGESAVGVIPILLWKPSSRAKRSAVEGPFLDKQPQIAEKNPSAAPRFARLRSGRRPELELDDQAVVRRFEGDFFLSAEQFGAHVGDDGALGSDVGEVLGQGRVVDVVFHDLVEEVGLAD